ncbi:hypothetical protein [Bacteroides fragilis]|nr:hypothetical protein [Bacteroides fragilis]
MSHQTKRALTVHNDMKKKMLAAIKEYLRLKHNRSINFYPDDEELSDILEENDFFPCNVTVFNKYECASSSALDRISLKKNQLIVDTAESGSILNEEELYYEDLINICDTIENYEKAIHSGIYQRMKRRRWKINVVKTLLNHNEESFEEVCDFVELYCKPDMSDEHIIKLFKSTINNKK